MCCESSRSESLVNMPGYPIFPEEINPLLLTLRISIYLTPCGPFSMAFDEPRHNHLPPPFSIQLFTTLAFGSPDYPPYSVELNFWISDRSGKDPLLPQAAGPNYSKKTYFIWDDCGLITILLIKLNGIQFSLPLN